MTKNLQLTIGLEIHCQINSNINQYMGKKLFSNSFNNSKAHIPNSQINFFDIGFPGTMPQLNLFCVQQAIKTGIALNGVIQRKNEFDRKHYFYPDLPSGFQITQYFHPIVKGGYIFLKNGKKINLHQIHIEADAGQSSHQANYSLVDFNRSMVPLMEIVTEPEMHSIEESIEFIKKLKLLLRYIKTCDGNMEEGNFRVDVNISLNQSLDHPLGTRVELKNLNSFKFIETAILYEVQRQTEILNKNEKIIQETRGFDSQTGTTYSLRKKETAPEYRYIWETNLPPIIIEDSLIEDLKNRLEELPDARYKRYKTYNLEDNVIEILLENQILQDFFENLLSHIDLIIPLSNWLVGDLYGLANKLDKSIQTYKKEDLINIVQMIQEEKISGKIGKYLLEQSWIKNLTPLEIVETENLWQVNNIEIIDKLIKEVLEEQKLKYEEYKKTQDERCLHFLVGCIIKKSAGKAAPNICKNRLLLII
jgi:aspartyl-tRNA(Asn)/glutamyl-tRNA(Gln) amidotransferase subunit B